MSAQLLVSSADARWRVRALHVNGQVSLVRRGLYAAPGADLAVSAAVQRLDAVASHETAAAMLGIPTLGASSAIQVTRTRRAQGTARYDGVVVHHARLDPGHVVVHDGIPITTPARTVMDLARSRPFRAGVVAADAALRLRRCTREELLAVADECRRWPGIKRARAVAGFADERAGSPLESISRVAFHHYGVPRPILQAVIGGFDEVDFFWAAYRVVGEADGMTKYTSVDVLRREKAREEGIVQLGFTVFRWTWRDAYRRPDALAHRAIETLARCGYRP